MATEMQTGTPATLRDEQTELTRKRIVDAVVRILARNVADLSVEAVAREAGVSRPTVYRYFKNKREMVEAVGMLYAQRIGTLGATTTANLDELLAMVPDVFARWARLEPELRAAARSSPGWESQARHLTERLAVTRRVLGPYMGDDSEADRDRLTKVVMVLMSSGMHETLQRYLETSSAEAAELVVWAIRRLAGERKNGKEGAG